MELKFVKNIFFIATVIFYVSAAYAEPKQIEIIGLIPGVSTKEQVQSAKSDIGFIIGGFELICSDEYIDGVLSNLTCFTGEEYYSKDTTKKSYTIASNLEVHSVLTKGFTKKFGKPSDIKNMPIHNSLGTEYNRNIVIWKDKKGNELKLFSLFSKTNDGLLLLESHQKVKLDAEKSKEEDKQRNF